MSTLQVIIPAYNAASFIAQTIDSVLQQNCDGLELLVLDNASTDETPRIAISYADRGVKHIRNATNVGAIGNHNLGLSLATADYLKLLSADDVLLPGVLANQKEALDKYPEVGLVTCNCIVTDSALNPVHETKYLPGQWDGKVAVSKVARKVANLIGAPSNVMLRRSAAQGISYDPGLKWLGDLDFACQVLMKSDYFNIDKPGFFYRRHHASDSVRGCPTRVRLHDEFAFVRKYGGGVSAKARILYRLTRKTLLDRLPASMRSGQ